jgi:hypothetical protein
MRPRALTAARGRRMLAPTRAAIGPRAGAVGDHVAAPGLPIAIHQYEAQLRALRPTSLLGATKPRC